MLNPNANTSIQGLNANLIQDPWDLLSSYSSSSEPSPSTPTATRVKTPSLISPVSNREALPMVIRQSHLEQSLLGDWLKLKTAQVQKLGEQIQQALGFLYWLESQEIADCRF